MNDITVAPTTGTTYIVTGAQNLVLNGAAQSILDIASGSSLTITSGLSGTYGFTKNSAGMLIFDSNTTTPSMLLGGITVNAGTLQAGSATTVTSSQVLRANTLNLLGTSSLTTVTGSVDVRVGALSGASTSSVALATSGSVNILALTDATYSGTITATGGLVLRGGNGTTQTFNGNLTGLTNTIGINSGATMKLSGTGDSTSGVLGSSGSNGIATRGGAFVLDNTGGNTSAATGRLADNIAVSMLGGTLSLIGNSGGTSETVGALTLNPGAATISVIQTGSNATTLTFTDTGSLRDSTAMTVNFTASGGALGGGGSNPAIKFTGTPITQTGGAATGLLSDTATGGTIGWATANGTDWAGYSASNGIVVVAPTLTTATNTGLQGATTSSVTLFNPSSSQTLTGAVSTATFKMAPTTGGLSLNVGTNSVSTVAVMLAGSNDFSITGSSGTLFGTGAGSRYVHVTESGTTLSVGVSLAGANQPFTKSGAGVLFLSGGSNQVGFTTNQNINIAQGVLRGTTTSLGGGASSGGAFTTINFYGGVLEISGGGSFSRAIDISGAAGGGGITFDTGGSARGDGGFSAIGGNATITLVSAIGGATPATLQWNDGIFLANGFALLMGSTKADSRIDFTNSIAFDNGTSSSNYFGREVRVIDNPDSSTDVARLSGVISGSAFADLLKTGGGELELTNTNTFTGNVLIQQGTLTVMNGAAISNSSAVVLSNAAGTTFKLGNNETIGALSGGGGTGGNVELGANTLTVGDQRDSTYAGAINGTGGALTKQGTGTLIISGTNTYTGVTTINGGTLKLDSSGALGGGGNVTFTGGTLQYTANGASIDLGSRIVNSSSTVTIDTNGQNVTYAGAINNTNTAGLAKSGAGTLILTADAGYTGGTTINNGTLQLGNGGAAGSITGAVTNSGQLVVNRTGSVSLTGAITGGGSVTITSGSVTLGTSNGFSGGFTLSGGTVIVSADNAFGTGGALNVNGGTIQSSGTRTFAPASFSIGGNFTNAGSGNARYSTDVSLGAVTRTISNTTTGGSRQYTGVISGGTGAGLTFDGTGAAQTYLGNTGNTFNGPVTINGGDVVFNGNGALGNTTSITIDGGQLSMASMNAGGTAAAITTTIDPARNVFVGDGAGTQIFVQSSGGSVTYNGVIADKPSETGSWNKAGAGTLNLGGANTYSGSTTVSNGTLKLTTGNDRLPTGTTVFFGETGTNNHGTLDLNGFNQTVAGLNSIGGGIPTVDNALTSASAATLTLGGPGTYNFGDGTDANSGVITGAISVVKSGSGSQTLGDVNTYIGGTTVSGGTLVIASTGSITGNATVSAGTLVINGTLSGGAITLNGGMLKGSGTVEAISVASSATLSPGNSIESLASGTVTLAANANLIFEYLNATGTTPGQDWDLIDLTASGGILNLGNATAANKINLYIDSWKLNNSSHGGGVSDGVNFNNFNPNASYEWLYVQANTIGSLAMTGGDSFESRFNIIDNQPGAGVFDTGNGNPFARPAGGAFGATWKNGSQGIGMYITYSAVPEPGSMLLAGLASIGAGWYGRRRLRNRPTSLPNGSGTDGGA